MTRFLATSLIALSAAGLFLGLPSQSHASGISLSIDIGRPVRPVVVAPAPVYVPARPVVVTGAYYPPPVVTYAQPVCERPLVGATVIVPAPIVVRPVHHHSHYPYWR